MALGGIQLFAADSAGLRRGTGGLVTGGVAIGGGQFFVTDGTGLRRGTGGLSAGGVTLCNNRRIAIAFSAPANMQGVAVFGA